VAVRLSSPARAAWSVLDAGDFAAVDDLLADLAERHGHGEPIDVVGSVDVGHYLVDVLARRAVVAMLTRTPTDIIVLAIGRT
jgi:hypothetical protein